MSFDSTYVQDPEVVSSQPWDLPAASCLHVVLAEEAEILREGFKVSLRALDRQVVIHEAASWDELLVVSGQVSSVDLLVVDEGLIPLAGEDLSTLKGFTANAPAVVMTGAESGSRMRCLIRQGARGYLSKKVGSRVFAGALKFVLDGGTYVSPEALIAQDNPADAGRSDAPEVTSRYHGRLRHDVTARLTARQIEVLEQLMKGRSNKQICRELNMAMGTVKSHIAAIFTTLQVNSRTAAIAAVTQVDALRPAP
ncbi:MAG: hypothetical protein GTN84_00335 [Hydrogenophaga sp.]|uniref:response regulator transcription factor n=1 Tax=Hydrogenophaga sp. TaxID=1904254 RepID=UPI0016A57BA7|nr:response regulator transcription factor [Hydrogenophaga sp.]NIM39599.1 hypothetical protein [Hydrogenophaga sp.]NIN24803.1 hypothetical protein [Hydrogenophaga sp.]NIN29315.1 hypothetical protein [Hydrogenophaga sp.]NIN53838.1 hypothetical protein [Hydrogenophaga sp.]NIO50042.1 hypothetical protein [Hydrogenophaga sp.]